MSNSSSSAVDEGPRDFAQYAMHQSSLVLNGVQMFRFCGSRRSRQATYSSATGKAPGIGSPTPEPGNSSANVCTMLRFQYRPSACACSAAVKGRPDVSILSSIPAGREEAGVPSPAAVGLCGRARSSRSAASCSSSLSCSVLPGECSSSLPSIWVSEIIG